MPANILFSQDDTRQIAKIPNEVGNSVNEILSLTKINYHHDESPPQILRHYVYSPNGIRFWYEG